MVDILIRGKPEKVSKEEVRAMVQATITVLEFHKLKPLRSSFTIIFTDDAKKLGTNHISGGVNGGWADQRGMGRICIGTIQDAHGILITIIHEIIHMYIEFPGNTEEHCVSTLVAKLKPTINAIYETLVANTYRNAAYLAHCKIAYVVKEDRYNGAQWNGEISKAGAKYRRRRGHAVAPRREEMK